MMSPFASAFKRLRLAPMRSLSSRGIAVRAAQGVYSVNNLLK